MAFGTCPMLKECCCGCTLNTGSMIIGYISLISSLILAGITAVYLDNNEELFKTKLTEAVIQMLVVVVNILIAFVSMLLIIGTHVKKSCYLLPWLITALITVPIDGVSLAIMLGKLTVGIFNPKVYGLFSHVSVTIYFFFVVYSYYRELKVNKHSKPV